MKEEINIPSGPHYENNIVPEMPDANKELRELWESTHETVSWSTPDNKVFVKIVQEGDRFVVQGWIESTSKHAEHSGHEWIDDAPTSEICATRDEADTSAKTMLGDRENWLQSN